jgi:hypothetical protein
MATRSKTRPSRVKGRALPHTLIVSLHFSSRGMTLAAISAAIGVRPGEGSFCNSSPDDLPVSSPALRAKLRRQRAGQSVLKVHHRQVRAGRNALEKAHEVVVSMRRRYGFDPAALKRDGIVCEVLIGVIPSGPVCTLEVPQTSLPLNGFRCIGLTVYR